MSFSRLTTAAVFILMLLAAPVFPAEVWSYYSYLDDAKDLAVEPNTLWVATSGGALKIDTLGGMLGKLTRAQGLCDNALTCVAVGKDGTKYFGTNGYGVATYKDGMVSHLSEDNGGLNSNNVFSIAVDSEGGVWFGCQPERQHCSAARLENGIWTIFDESCPGFAGGQMNRVKVIDDVVYVCSGNGLSWFDGTEWACYNAENSLNWGLGGVVDVVVTGDGALFVATMWEGLFSRSGDEWSNHPLRDGDDHREVLTALELGASGELWVGTARQGLYCYDGGTLLNYRAEGSAVPDNWVNAITTAGSTAYFGTQKGIASTESGEWGGYFLPTTVPDNYITSISAGPDGSVWFGSFSGAARCKDDQWKTFTTSNSGLVGEAATFVAASPWGDVWFDCNDDFNRLSNGSWSSWTRKEIGDMVGMRDAAFAPDGVTWFAFTNGFASFKDGIWDSKYLPFGEYDGDCNAVAIDLSGILWLATRYHGVFSYDGSSYTNYSIETGDLPANYVSDLVTGIDGAMWSAIPGCGVWRFDGSSWEGMTPDNSGLPSTDVTALGIDGQGALWFGSQQNGAACWDGLNWTYYRIDNSPISDELVSEFAFAQDGSVWMVNRVGVSVLRMLPELPALSIEVAVNSPSYSVGDTMVVSLGAANYGEALQLVDVFVALLLPNGSLLYYPSWFDLPNPYLMAVPLAPGAEYPPSPIFTHTFADAIVEGEYTWLAALTPPGQIAQRLAVSSDSWQFGLLGK